MPRRAKSKLAGEQIQGEVVDVPVDLRVSCHDWTVEQSHWPAIGLLLVPGGSTRRGGDAGTAADADHTRLDELELFCPSQSMSRGVDTAGSRTLKAERGAGPL